MYIAPLQQALCADRCQITRGPEPGNWIVPSLPDGWRLLSFHFFVDWRQTPPIVADRIWMTRQLRFEAGDSFDTINDEKILRQFYAGPTNRDFEDLERACAPCGHVVSTILLPEIPVTDIHDHTPVWAIDRRQNGDLRIIRGVVQHLKNAIQHHSGGPVHVGNKGLTYGTSAVECYLSRSDAAFPGDADAVIVDAQNQIRCIIEYKKHTLNAPIGQHLAGRYYPHPDGRKYQRLEALAARCRNALSSPVPLIVLYYSTRTPVIRLQEIGNLNATGITIKRDSNDMRIHDSISDDVVNWFGMY
ncbi:hypothetical protein FNI11_07290 [Salmonella enterica subsp. salamae]|nr:hypothetical protein [Salmonella enterica subsp. salamae]ECJ2282751.1 hypothetical protein [Salmonella enterica subsp. salamae]